MSLSLFYRANVFRATRHHITVIFSTQDVGCRRFPCCACSSSLHLRMTSVRSADDDWLHKRRQPARGSLRLPIRSAFARRLLPPSEDACRGHLGDEWSTEGDDRRAQHGRHLRTLLLRQAVIWMEDEVREGVGVVEHAVGGHEGDVPPADLRLQLGAEVHQPPRHQGHVPQLRDELPAAAARH